MLHDVHLEAGTRQMIKKNKNTKEEKGSSENVVRREMCKKRWAVSLTGDITVTEKRCGRQLVPDKRYPILDLQPLVWRMFLIELYNFWY